MLAEFREMRQKNQERVAAGENLFDTKVEFLKRYVPLRQTFDKFLAGGSLIHAPNIAVALADRVNQSISLVFGDNERRFPFWNRGINIFPFGENEPVILTVQSQAYIGRPYKKEIEKSWLLVTVNDKNENDIRAHLPPIDTLQKSPDRYIYYMDVPDRVGELLPFLSSSSQT